MLTHTIFHLDFVVAYELDLVQADYGGAGAEWSMGPRPIVAGGHDGRRHRTEHGFVLDAPRPAAQQARTGVVDYIGRYDNLPWLMQP